MSATIRTEKFRIAPATYLRVVAGSSLPSLLASIVLLALISIAAGVLFDIRIILVALIFIFLVFPFYIYYIYFTRLLTVEAQNSVRPKDVTIHPHLNIIETFHAIDESLPVPSPICHPWTDISHARIDRRHLLIYFNATPNVPLIVPLDSLPPDVGSSRLREIFPAQTF